MKYILNRKRKIAIGFTMIWALDMGMPLVSMALTSGPSQPEVAAFQQAGVSDMVDVGSGDFKYNIPLLDVGGYPINLAYQSGTGIDDEASWVGLGWTLNPGSVNRQVRGVPDDFSGADDQMVTTHYTKPKVTIGGRVTGKFELFGFGDNKSFSANGSLTVGLFNDNYTGFGAEVGANAGISYSTANSGGLTAGLGVGVLSNTQSGADASISPYVSMPLKAMVDDHITTRAGLSGSLGFNSRSGLKSFTMASSFSVSAQGNRIKKINSDELGNITSIDTHKGNIDISNSYNVYGSTISYNSEPVSPSIGIPYFSNYSSFSVDIGGAVTGGFLSVGGTGYENVRQVKTVDNSRPAYGFLYAQRGKNNTDAIMDFTREKDNPVIPEIPNLAIPVHTPDLWSFTNQLGSGQFRLYRNGSGAFFDNTTTDESKTTTIGADYGFGEYFHGGVTFFNQNATTTTRKWSGQNAYLAAGDFPNEPVNPGSEQAYFKLVGEKNTGNDDLYNNAWDTRALQVDISNDASGASALNHYNNNMLAVKTISNTKPQVRRMMISYLTAAEATLAGYDRDILVYAPNTASDNSYSSSTSATTHVNRIAGYRKKNHISEIAVTDPEGKRMIYGIPVYNTAQTEYTFAVGRKAQTNGTGNYPANTNKYSQAYDLSNPKGITDGIDGYYHKETTPAYATSYLLTSILSPDYVDVTNNGISEDDLGTAVKFNYSMISGYKWTSSFKGAILNKGLLADPDDDKASIVSGEKELWNVSSIETKTEIAYFITEDRYDGLGAVDAIGGDKSSAVKQKRLKEIRLYSRMDMSKPIKIVKFEYTYELCRGVPNSTAYGTNNPLTDGKLTLKRVWFQYGNSTKGANHAYAFQYNKTGSAGVEIKYGNMNGTLTTGDMLTDRWGNYKLYTNNPAGMGNDVYPYSVQDRNIADQDVALWHLSGITLPTGGQINVTYEASDYAYVQDKQAMVMSSIAMVSAPSSSAVVTSLEQAKGVKINIGTTILPASTDDPTRWFKSNFLNNSDYLYTKFRVRVSTDNSEPHTVLNDCDYDYVPVYCEISNVVIDNGFAYVMFKDLTEGKVTANPISMAAYQRIKNEYPRFAYKGFDKRNKNSSSSVAAAVAAIVSAVSNFSELGTNFYEKAQGNHYANDVKVTESFVKIAKIDGKKIGGGARVKKIQISDNWSSMTADANVVSGMYGQSYDYTTKLSDGRVISSGVATYEPAVGNDENALKAPVPYIQKIKGAINNYFSLEEPFVESLYPAPGIAYSKVTVRDLDASGNTLTKIGYTVNEFYTAKDFPVKVTVLPIKNIPYKPSSNFGTISSNSVDKLCLSQGYSIALNDMQGKPKANRTFNESGSEIASTVYYYATDAQGKNLDNTVTVLDNKGVATNRVIGRDIEFFTDFREQESVNSGRSVNLGVDVIPFFIPPVLPIPHFPASDNNDYRLFRSACALKVIQTYGLITRVVKTVDGSSVTTENEAYDANTGEALVTRTNNEFKKSIYATAIPAYWAYTGMQGAFGNAGGVFQQFSVDANGLVLNGAETYLNVGDELVDVSDDQYLLTHFWVIENQASPGTSYRRLITATGRAAGPFTNRRLKIVRSGNRNLLTAMTHTFSSLGDPISGGQLQIRSSAKLTGLNVINASLTTFNSTWPVHLNCDAVTDEYFKTGTFADSYYKISNLYPPLTPNALHGSNGTHFTDPDPGGTYTFHPSYFDNRLDKVGVWVGPHSVNTPVGFVAKFNVPVSKFYNVGYSGDDSFTLYFDNDPANKSLPSLYPGSDYTFWMIKPMYLSAGDHTLYAKVVNNPAGSGGENDTNNPGIVAVEIYDNSYAQLSASNLTESNLNIIFTTQYFPQNKVNAADVPPFSPPYKISPFRTSGTTDVAQYANRSYFNPFITGVYGNWRSYENKTILQQRSYPKPAGVNTGVNLKNAGYINDYYSYWYSDGTKWLPNPNATRWVTANTVTAYDHYGQEVENKDALGRFSGALFGFHGAFPEAVASNAKNRELFSMTFEDRSAGYGSDVSYCFPNGGFTPAGTPSSIAHSGNNSLLLSGELKISGKIHNKELGIAGLTINNGYNEYLPKPDAGSYVAGLFEADRANDYIFTIWTHDDGAVNKNVNVSVGTNADGVVSNLTCKAVVEGWKLIEGRIKMPTTADDIVISVKPLSGVVNVDDIRIHPFKAHMKTFVYNPGSFKLMAELDENGFATFYEYDDEGQLIRVKRETERGIMTVKETRSSYRKTL